MTVASLAVDAALVVLGLAFALSSLRIALGPTRTDRVIAADLSFFLLVGVIGLLALRLDAPVLLDVVLVAALVGFLSTVALAGLIRRGDP